MSEDRLFDLDGVGDGLRPWQKGGAPREIDEPAGYVGRGHPETAQAMERKALPRSGVFRREIYDLLLSDPMTDDELERVTRRSHQSVSGARATLKKDGWARDSGLRRRNRYGHEAIVWEAVRP